MAVHLRASGLEFDREFRFHPTRKWRADFRIGDLLIEVDGGNRMAVHSKAGPVAVGRHVSEGDYEKMAHAAILGYRVIRVTPAQVRKGLAIKWIEEAVHARN